MKYAELEKDLGETERGRAIFEMAIEQRHPDLLDHTVHAHASRSDSDERIQREASFGAITR